ncbi:ROK family protein [Globicatella sanguinis]|uniref:ROK family protein n=1 Tax=Globicatella sanguinis TaxID=13076 RepID=UPI00254398A1|nr:ROK family protein [Globicatella sanguinis]MDK7630474.1 ROK family protein [Globicatella sanguinis]WIK66211.1 ROK family protein [Globicatella sanguinis]WKT55616.1 ROK family protein [Globicatella sanguinis]
MNKDVALGIDIGGTKVAVAIVNRFGQIEYRHELPSDIKSSETLFQTVLSCIQKVLDESGLAITDFYGIGAGVPGKVDHNNGIAIFQNNIPWDNFPFVERIKNEFNDEIKVVIDNDVKVAAYAEYATRHLPAEATFTYLTISTGIASTTIVNNTILRGSGFSGEIGFLPLKVNNQYIDLEKFAAGPGIQAAYPGVESTKEVFNLAYDGDEKAIAIIKSRAHAMAIGIYSIVCTLDPNMIVLGGSVAYNNPRFVDAIIEELRGIVIEEQSHILNDIVRSVLGSDNGIVGAGMLAFNLK